MNLAVSLLARGRDDAVALVTDGMTVSYADLREAVARAAGAWRALGVVPGERVAIALADDTAWVAAFLGAIRAGAVAVALNPRLAPADRDALAAEGAYAAWLGEDPAPAPAGVGTVLARVAEPSVNTATGAAAASARPAPRRSGCIRRARPGCPRPSCTRMASCPRPRAAASNGSASANPTGCSRRRGCSSRIRWPTACSRGSPAARR